MNQPYFLGMSTTDIVEYIRKNGQDWYLEWSDLSACIALCCRAQVYLKNYTDKDGRIHHTAMLKDAAERLGINYEEMMT